MINMAQNFSLASRIKVCVEGLNHISVADVHIKLGNAGQSTMPLIHLGLYLMSGKEASQAVQYALDVSIHGRSHRLGSC